MEDNKKKLKIKVFTAFSGYDSQCMALDRLKENYDWFDYELVGWSEIDEPAIRTHNAVYPQYADRNYGDISKIKWDEVPDFDLFTYSSPCFIAGTEVLVKKSIYDDYPNRVPIENVKVGDLVLTHTGEYKKVLECMKTPYIGLLYTLFSSWGDEVTCTPDHKFYCSLDGVKPTAYEWVSAKDIELGYHHPVTAVKDKWDGEYYLSDHPDFSKIEITLSEREIYVYNLEVEDNHSYTANDFVVHNCQSFSICGKQEGGEEGSGTRSSLLWECRKTIQMKKPKFCILENVKALVSNKFLDLFERWIKTVNSMGYVSKWTVLNASHYDIPQGRERVFLVSVRKDSEDDKPEYFFPAPIPRTREVEDFFDQEAPEEYYLDDRDVPKFMDFLNNTGDHFVQTTEIHQEIAEVKIQEEAEKKKAEEENKTDPYVEVEGGLF